jgi:triphosphoribosyl-dephospho-CoA synthase
MMMDPVAKVGVRPATTPQAAVSRRTLAGIATTAADCLLQELETWPKPGLVSHIDAGGHEDMDAGTFRDSIRAIAPFLHEMAQAGAGGCGMTRLRVIGLAAEEAMFAATHGVNTHRGAIFGLGLLCAAAGARAGGRVDAASSLGAVVSDLWGTGILDGPILLHSHGNGVRRKFGARGARLEAALGFPSVYAVGLPTLRRISRAMPDDAEAVRVGTCFALIAVLEDTNLLHRGGMDGLRYARRIARSFIRAGGVHAPDWRARACMAHQGFIARRLSPGGSADLLALTLFVDALDRMAP